MQRFAVPIPVVLVDDPWVRLLSGDRLRAALRDRGMVEGFRVEDALAPAGDRLPWSRMALAAALYPEQLHLSPEGTRVDLDLGVVDGEWSFPREKDMPGFGCALTPEQARRRLASLIRWPVGDKVVVPGEPSRVPGLRNVTVHVGLRSSVRRRHVGGRQLAATQHSGAPVRLPLAAVRPEATGLALRWAAVLSDPPSLDPVAELLRLSPGRWEAECPSDVQSLPWLVVGVRLTYGDDSHVALQITVMSSSEPRLAAAAEDALADERVTDAALSVARAWPGRVLLYAVGWSEGGPLLVLALEGPGQRSDARVLARTALRATLCGMPEDALSARLREVWQDPRRLAALRVLYSL